MGSRWERRRLKLKGDHGWKARPGYQIFVADRGAVRFDFPAGWLVEPGEDSIKFRDKKPPDDNCTLYLTVMRLPPQIDWSELPLSKLMREVVLKDDDPERERQVGEINEVRRPDLDLVWVEVRFKDPEEKRPARSRICLSRAKNIQPLITFDFWEDDAPRMIPVWEEVLRSLRLGQYIADPTRGDMRHRDN